jgi:hypothetical protein
MIFQHNVFKIKKEMKNIKLFESFSNENDDALERLKKKYPESIITMTPSEKFKESYFARVDIKTQGGEKEYLGALKGPVSKYQAIEFFESTLYKNYDKYY